MKTNFEKTEATVPDMMMMMMMIIITVKDEFQNVLLCH
jgi:hypothetical protein